ncbi:MAG: LacI family DNA-binding transcriptional regulator [Ignavibacteria bacterium]|jgi:LacI family transcriptional regulator/LacI family repressor for deo operon, udp, cdd, tsx, nupC, and nupG
MQMTISDIAKLANVSKSAVSIVINNKPGVSEKTRAKVLATIKKFNYNPNSIAQSLAAKETKSIGLVIKEIDNPYFAKVMKGVYDECSRLGYSVLLGSSELCSDKETEIVNAMLNKRVDGLLLSPLQSEKSDFSYLSKLLSNNYPLVTLGMVKNYYTNTVDIDNIKAAYDAVSYLAEFGHTKVAYFAGPSHSGHGQKRLEGYKQALIDHNILINNNYIVVVEPYMSNGYNAGLELFKKNIDQPTAVFCYNDLVAVGLINALLDLNIKVPGKVSVIGFDNIDLSKYVRIPLTTIQMPAYEIGKSAANLLIKQITSSETPSRERIVLEHKLIERSSCAKLVKV